MFCEPKGQELNTFIFSIFFDTPGCVHIDLKKWCLIRLCADLMSKSNLTHLRKETQ